MAVVDRFHVAFLPANPRQIEGGNRKQMVFMPSNPRAIEGVQRHNVAPIFVGDSLPPVLDSAWSPAAGTILANQVITLPLKDTQIPQSAVVTVTIWVDYGNNVAELVFDTLTGFYPPYSALSSTSSGALGTQHVAFHIARTNGWKYASTTLKVYAGDQQANIALYSSAYTVSNPSGIVYKMLGYDHNTGASDTWLSFGGPDPTGAQYTGGLTTPLRNIAILSYKYF